MSNGVDVPPFFGLRHKLDRYAPRPVVWMLLCFCLSDRFNFDAFYLRTIYRLLTLGGIYVGMSPEESAGCFGRQCTKTEYSGEATVPSCEQNAPNNKKIKKRNRDGCFLAHEM